MGGSISRDGKNKKGLAIGLGVGLGVFAWPFLACLAVNVIPEGTLTTNVLTANEVTIKYSNCIGRGDKFLSPPFRAILSFSRCAHWLSCCAHGGFFVCLGVEEWERWTTWVGFRCGAVASARESLPPSALHVREPVLRLEAERKDCPKGRSFP